MSSASSRRLPPGDVAAFLAAVADENATAAAFAHGQSRYRKTNPDGN
jgi:hypothetical protein